LANGDTDGRVILFLDADMKPVESYLLRVIPLLLEEQPTDSLQAQLVAGAQDPELGGGTSGSWQINRDIGFVGCPQRFTNVSGDAPDYCAYVGVAGGAALASVCWVCVLGACAPSRARATLSARARPVPCLTWSCFPRLVFFGCFVYRCFSSRLLHLDLVRTL